MPPQSTLGDQLTEVLGRGFSDKGHPVWVPAGKGYEVVASEKTLERSDLKGLRDRRDDRRAASVIAICAPGADGNVKVIGPTADGPMREFAIESVLTVLDRSLEDENADNPSAFIEREFRRLEESIVPGVRVKDLLTPYYVRERLLHNRRLEKLAGAIDMSRLGRGSTNSRRNFETLGWELEQTRGGFLLKHQGATRAVLHVKSTAAGMSRMSAEGVLPEGALINACGEHNLDFGIMAHGSRLRLFRARPEVGSAVSSFIEIDVAETRPEDKAAARIFSPAALSPVDRDKDDSFYVWEREARDYGERLREDLQKRLIEEVLPTLAQGIGEWQKAQGVDLSKREELDRIERAVLTLVFRFMFLLHVEARNYLPVTLPAYRPHSATELAKDCAAFEGQDDTKTSHFWQRLITLVEAVRNGNETLNVPQYNGSLFAATGFPGAELLEQAEISDKHLAPALRDIAYAPGNLEAGLDYASLQIGHLGAIYEALLSRRLVLAREGLVLDKRRDTYAPAAIGETPEIAAYTLFYQNEKGGRKAGGVYYTRREFVAHLLRYSLIPALDDHLVRVDQRRAEGKAKKAAKELFEFYVVDPAMGSGHFLTVALDMMADRFEDYLTEAEGMPEVHTELQRLRGNVEDSGYDVEDVDLLRRLILKRCVYGVDISPLAVEIANVTLWLGSFMPGLALSYLGSNLKCGDALMGIANSEAIAETVGKNLFGPGFQEAMDSAVEQTTKLRSILDVNAAQVRESQLAASDLDEATICLRKAYNLWTAEHLGVQGGREAIEIHVEDILESGSTDDDGVNDMLGASTRIADEYGFFHWPIEFPQVFRRENPGFDVVVGNPPWEKVRVERLAFYALHRPGLRGIKDQFEQLEIMAEMAAENPEIESEAEAISARSSRMRRYFTNGGDYQQQGPGDADLFKLFSERYAFLNRRGGRFGVVLPRSCLVNSGSAKFRKWLLSKTTVTRIDTILNSRKWAFPIHGQFQLALLVARKSQPGANHLIRLTGFSASLSQFQSNSKRLGVIPPASVIDGNGVIPNVGTADSVNVLELIWAGMPFASTSSRQIEGAVQPIGARDDVLPLIELHETAQKRYFRHKRGLAVWKGRSFHDYDPHGRDPAGHAQRGELTEWLMERRKRSRDHVNQFSRRELDDPESLPIASARVAFHEVTNAIDFDTVVACLIPPMTPLTYTAPYLACRWSPLLLSYALGILNSTTFDWQSRRVVSLHLNPFVINMLRFPPPERINAPAPPPPVIHPF